MRRLAMAAAVLAAAQLSATAPPDPVLEGYVAAILRNDCRADRAQLLTVAHDPERGPGGRPSASTAAGRPRSRPRGGWR